MSAYLIAFAVILASGQALFKRVGLQIRDLRPGDMLLAALRDPILYTALALYAVATLLWIWILSRVPLSQAYPWVAVGMVIVPLFGHYFFGERLTLIFWAGVVLIMAGIILVQYGAHGT